MLCDAFDFQNGTTTQSRVGCQSTITWAAHAIMLGEEFGHYELRDL